MCHRIVLQNSVRIQYTDIINTQSFEFMYFERQHLPGYVFVKVMYPGNVPHSSQGQCQGFKVLLETLG